MLGTYPLAFALERTPLPVVFSGAALAAFVLAGAVLLVFFCASIFGAAAFGQMDRHFASRKQVILGAMLASSVSLAVLAGVQGLPVSLVIGLLLIAVFAQ